MGIRNCVWLILLHMIAVWLPCSAVAILIKTPELGAEKPVGPDYMLNSAEQDPFCMDLNTSRKYSYVHNEAHIATARAEALHEGGDLVSPLLSVHVPGTFPDLTPSEDGCYLQSARDLEWDDQLTPSTFSYDHLEVLAVDSCAGCKRSIYVAYREYGLSSRPWVKKPDILIRSDNPRSFNVLVKLGRMRSRMEEQENEMLAEGVYFPGTGKMHLVGCSYKSALTNYSHPRRHYKFGNMTLGNSAAPQTTLKFNDCFERRMMKLAPLNSSTPADCAISITLQYPALQTRWNRDRVVRYDIRSKRERSDPLYFDPLERSVFKSYFDFVRDMGLGVRQRTIEICGRIVLLLLGLVCLALQIEHGRWNEEALPFVSLAMVGIQLAHHFSQISIFKDLRIGAYRGISDLISSDSRFDDYYEIMSWCEHIPYQAMAMSAIFMYVWVFHRVGDRRRIMSLRVRRKRPGARDAPSEWRVLYATLAFFSLVCLLAFLAISADQHGHIRRASTGMTSFPDYHMVASKKLGWLSARSRNSRPQLSHFVPWQLYTPWEARWRIINKLTGLVVSLFLVPQLLGNALWEVQGRPLSAWFYAGIPLLQSLPHAFRIGQYFDLVPIFSFYDPYFNSIVGMHEFEKVDLWWPITVVVCSALQVLAVHAQFLRSLRSHSNPKSTSGRVQTCDML